MAIMDDVTQILQAKFSDGSVEVSTFHGGDDHLQAVIVSPQFAGLTLVQQHQLVYQTLGALMDSEAVHALGLKTFTPESWDRQTSQQGD